MRQTGFGVVVKAIIRDRANGLCERCGEYAYEMQHHHRRARGMGSTRRPETNMPANALAVCPRCHSEIESYRSVSYDSGWLVHQSRNPADIPVLRRGVWVLLDDLGGVNPVEEHDHSPIKTAVQRVESDEAAGAGNTIRPLTTPSDHADRRASHEC